MGDDIKILKKHLKERYAISLKNSKQFSKKWNKPGWDAWEEGFWRGRVSALNEIMKLLEER